MFDIEQAAIFFVIFPYREAIRSGRSRELSSLVGFGAKPHRSPRLRSNVIIRQAAQRHLTLHNSL